MTQNLSHAITSYIQVVHDITFTMSSCVISLKQMKGKLFSTTLKACAKINISVHFQVGMCEGRNRQFHVTFLEIQNVVSFDWIDNLKDIFVFKMTFSFRNHANLVRSLSCQNVNPQI